MANNHKSSRGKKILIHFMSLLSALVLIFISTILVAGVTLFNDKDLMLKVSDTTYFAELNNEIVTRCSTVAVKSGIDYEAVKPVITSGRIDSDFTVYFNSVSKENPTAGRDTIDEKALADELYSAIVSYDPDITESEKDNAEIIAGKMAEEYKNAIIAENFESFMAFSDRYQGISRNVLFILLALFAYLTCMMVFANGKDQKHRLFRRFSVVSGSCGVTVLAFSLLVKISAVLEKIAFAETQREYNLFMSFFDNFINCLIGAGCVWVVICAVLVSIWYMSVTGRLKR